MGFFGQDIGIDLGTATVLVFVKDKGVILNEPSVVAIDRSTGKVLAVGADAQQMLGRTPGNIVALRPMKDGVISNYDITEKMIRHFLRKACGVTIFKPRVIICVPSRVTEVEGRAVVDAAIQAGARQAYLIEEPVAAAIGAGIDISKPNGNMVVDIGGGTSDVAVISLGGIVVSDSIRVAGDRFDEAIIKYVKKKYSVLIGERTAEEIKFEIGCVYPFSEIKTAEAKGRCLVTGLPKTVTLDSEALREAVSEETDAIVRAVCGVIEKTPPELTGDIYTNGIAMTGGGSMLYGFDLLLSEKTGIKAFVTPDAVTCVANGTGKTLDYIDTLNEYNSKYYGVKNYSPNK
jgi:rod shape-determining protein MreB